MNAFKLPDQSAFHNGTISLYGKVHTELSSTESGILPGLGMRIELAFSSPDFVLQVPKAEQARFKITIEKATLYCPVGQLSAEMFRKIDQKLNTDTARLYISRCEVTNKSIPFGNNIFTDRIFAGANLPSKLIVAFIATESFIGTQKSNPFFFARKFPTPDAEDVEQVNVNENADENGSERSFVTCERYEGGSDICFIEKVSLKLNGDSLDGFDGNPATWREDRGNYTRLHYYMGFMHSRTGNTLTYEEFMNGFYFVYFDLSTCAQSNLEFVVPAVRQGNLHIEVRFSKGTPHELTMLLFAEYPTLLKIDKNRQIQMSY